MQVLNNPHKTSHHLKTKIHDLHQQLIVNLLKKNSQFVGDNARGTAKKERRDRGSRKARGHLLPAEPAPRKLILPEYQLDPLHHYMPRTTTIRVHTRC
jgi:hypothetical protein